MTDFLFIIWLVLDNHLHLPSLESQCVKSDCGGRFILLF